MRLVTERRADRATLALRYQEETLEQENRRRRREVAVLRQEPAFAKKVAADSTGHRSTA